MMIRINLLPTRQVKRRGQGTQVLTLLAAALVLVLAGNYYWYTQRQAVTDELATRIAALQAQIEEKKRVLKEVENITARRDEVKRKLAVLQQLRDGRTGPVRLLDALASVIPHNVWLKDFAQGGASVKLSGQARTNDDVAELMRGLSNVVWTSKGLGVLVEQQRPEAKTSRVELLAAEGIIEEFPLSAIKPFFTNVDLKGTKAERASRGPGNESTVSFELTMGADYAN